MDVYTYENMYSFIYKHIGLSEYTCMCICMDGKIYVYINTYRQNIDTYIYMKLHACMYQCVWIYSWIKRYVYMSIYTCT